MFLLRRVLCEGLGRGTGLLPGSGGRLTGSQSCFAAWRALETRACIVHVRNYAQMKKQDSPSQLDDLPPTMLQKDYADVQLEEDVDDVVKRLMSLEMASQSEKLRVKTQQLVEKVKRNPNDDSSPEVRIAKMTARIRNFQEHIQKHPKDKANKRKMLMSMDRRKKLLKNLRLTHYDAFENVCKQLGIEYTFPPEYYRRATRRWLAKKALCLKVYQETKRLQAAGLLKKRKSSQAKTPENQGTPV
ncbi:small ribosomal subunit protein uS15m [Pelobates fuscus]|uniref:small ribosomal subunit protein uS15m n=1 Tax=Pelobates fuscus TaxID=191477 RepID=UPI002FE4682C